ncbi:MAG: hydroxyacylglutathione hydrolase [Methylophilaceae bacterium]|nr:hydroxyacylglutathione hydrolase [Methylophilaceae bacterium]
MDIVPLRAFQDNYIWLLIQDRHAVVVDPGDARPVQTHLQRHALSLRGILITHHHGDHVGGVEALLQGTAIPVYAPRHETFSFPHHPVGEGERIQLPELDMVFEVLDVPGHTAGHVAYYGGNTLFCGDTLFGGGCGRVFEGTCRQLYHSLQKLARLPDETQVYCAHEYTLANLRFALSVDPGNPRLMERMQHDSQLAALGKPTLPSTLALEKSTNPFLRCHTPPLQTVASLLEPLASGDPEVTFCVLREMKNSFKS